MTSLRAVQNRFLEYLRHGDDAISADIGADTDDERARRLSIYYNAYRARLYSSIEIDHEILGRYLGDEGFDRMAATYIDTFPSAETSLRHFCDQLPGFLAQHTPFSDIKVLAWLAKFERLLLQVFDAADAAREDVGTLSTLQPEQWPQLTFGFHPSVRLHVTPWNEIEIWRAIKAERDPPEAVEGVQQAWLVWRNPERLSEFRSLPIDEYTILDQAIGGANFASLCESLLEWHTETAVAGRALELLQLWFSSGLIVNHTVTR